MSVGTRNQVFEHQDGKHTYWFNVNHGLLIIEETPRPLELLDLKEAGLDALYVVENAPCLDWEYVASADLEQPLLHERGGKRVADRPG